MGYFQVRYDSRVVIRVVIYERKKFISLATGAGIETRGAVIRPR